MTNRLWSCCFFVCYSEHTPGRNNFWHLIATRSSFEGSTSLISTQSHRKGYIRGLLNEYVSEWLYDILRGKLTMKTKTYVEEELSRYRTTGCYWYVPWPEKTRFFLALTVTTKGAQNNHNLPTCATPYTWHLNPWTHTPSQVAILPAKHGSVSLHHSPASMVITKPPTQPPTKTGKPREIATKLCKQWSPELKRSPSNDTKIWMYLIRTKQQSTKENLPYLKTTKTKPTLWPWQNLLPRPWSP